MFSATVRVGTRRNSWYTMPTPAAMASAGEWNERRWPFTHTSPASGRYIPANTLTMVVLPAPFSPKSA